MNASRFAVCVLVLAVITPASAAAQDTKGTARIRGTVTAADTGRPIRRATVRLSTTRGTSVSTTTDVDGHFQFPDLTAGEYTLTAIRAGYVQMAFGQQSSGGEAQRVRLTAGQRFDSAHIRLPRGGAISGRVFDEFGDPIPEAHVQAFRAQYVQGMRRLSQVNGVFSNDIGEFRLYGLPPGTYYVSGTVRSGELPVGGDLTGARTAAGAEGFAQTFYPTGFAPADARPMRVEAAQEIANVDFQLQPARLVRVSGRVVDSRGRPVPGMAVIVNSARPDAVLIGSTRMAKTDADGHFRITGMSPGEYRLDARDTAELEAIAKTGRVVGISQDENAAEFASVPLTVGGEDLDGFVVTTSRGHSLSGRLLVEGGTLDRAALQKVSVGTYDVGAGGALSGLLLMASGNVQPDLTFHVRGVVGTRVIRVDGLPEGWALKTVQADGIDVTDAGVHIRGSDVIDVNVIVAPSAEASGAVVDAREHPAGDRTVIVFPEDARRWTGFMNRYVVSVRAAADGTFTIRALPPGSYFIAVVDPVAESEWMAPENLERLRASATKFSIVEGQKKTLRLVAR